MDYIFAVFNIDSSSRFLFLERGETDRHTDKLTNATDHPTRDTTTTDVGRSDAAPRPRAAKRLAAIMVQWGSLGRQL